MWKRFATLLIATSLTALTAAAAAQDEGAAARYPDRPLRFVVGFPPGGVADIAARVIAGPLGDRLGQPVILDNRAGAGGVIGVETVAAAAPDGYTMGFGVSGALTANVTLMPNLPYDPLTDLAPVSMAIVTPLMLAVNSSLGVDSLEAFVAKARANPAKFSYGTAGPGTAMNLAGELLKQTAGIQMEHVPYKGSSPAVTDLLAGHITAVICDIATLQPHLDSGRLKALAITGATRTPLAPDVPTVAESGMPGFDVSAWFGVLLPAGTPPAIVAKLHDALVAVLGDPKVREQLLSARMEPVPSSSQALRERIGQEIDKYAKLIKSANIVRN